MANRWSDVERARCYLVTMDSIVVAKHAVGPDRHNDGQERYPDVPATWLLVTFDIYKASNIGDTVMPDGSVTASPKSVGRPLKLEERLMQLEARIKALEKKGR